MASYEAAHDSFAALTFELTTFICSFYEGIGVVFIRYLRKNRIIIMEHTNEKLFLIKFIISFNLFPFDQSLCLGQLAAPDVWRRHRIVNKFIKFRICDSWLVKLVVTVLAPPDQLGHHIATKLGAEANGELGGVDDALR